MGIENFISTALCYPSDYVAYHVSKELAELYPEKAIVHGETVSFDLDAYLRAGLCELVEEPGLHQQFKTLWRGPGEDLRRDAENAWFNVFWRGCFLEVLFVTWTDDGCKSRSHWIIAESAGVAEDFFKTVCEWCSEVRGEILVFDQGE